MKKFNKILSVGLSLVLCAGMVTPAFAASFTDLQNAIEGTNTELEFYGRDEGQETGGIGAWTEDGTRKVELYEDVKYGEDESPKYAANNKTTGILIKGEGTKVEIELNGHDIDLNPNAVLNAEDGKFYQAETDENGEKVRTDQEATELNQGAVITVADGAALTVNDSTAKDEDGNYVAGQGTGSITGGNNSGGLWNKSKTGLTGNTNTHYQGGGVTVVDAGSSFAMNGGSITGNNAGKSFHGGGIYVETYGKDISVALNGVTVSNNWAAGQGGGIRFSGSSLTSLTSLTVKDSIIEKNVSTGNGSGGIYVDGGSVIIENTQIINNQTNSNWAAAGLTIGGTGGTASLKNVTITGNKNRNSTQGIGGLSIYCQYLVSMDGVNVITGNKGAHNSFGSRGNDLAVCHYRIELAKGGSLTTTQEGTTYAYNVVWFGDDQLESGKESMSDDARPMAFAQEGIVNPAMSKAYLTIKETADGVDVTVKDEASGSATTFNVTGEVTVDKETGTTTVAPGGTITPVGGNEIPAPYGAIILLDGTIIIAEAPKNPEDPDGGNGSTTPVSNPGVAGIADAGLTTIEAEEVPLAGLVSVQEVLEELYKHEGSPDGEDPEGEYDLAVAWAIANEIIDEDCDVEEIVTVVILRDILTKYIDFAGIEYTLNIEGEDDDIVDNCGEILTELFAADA